MAEFQTLLMREKITFETADENAVVSAADLPPPIHSNRIDLTLEKFNITERVVVRAQNMHTTLRLAARVFTSFYKIPGGLLSGDRETDWNAIWEQSLSDYENDFNSEKLWGAIYIKGTPIFKTRPAQFMDVIEQCALASQDDYDQTGRVAETVLKKLGRDLRVIQTNNISTTIHDDEDGLRGGIMHRGSSKKMIFNFLMTGGQSRPDRIFHGLMMSAAYLEIFNLKFLMIKRQRQLSEKVIKASSLEAEQLYATLNRVMALNREILSIESLYTMHYRPERPTLL